MERLLLVILAAGRCPRLRNGEATELPQAAARYSADLHAGDCQPRNEKNVVLTYTATPAADGPALLAVNA